MGTRRDGDGTGLVPILWRALGHSARGAVAALARPGGTALRRPAPAWTVDFGRQLVSGHIPPPGVVHAPSLRFDRPLQCRQHLCLRMAKSRNSSNREKRRSIAAPATLESRHRLSPDAGSDLLVPAGDSPVGFHPGGVSTGGADRRRAALALALPWFHPALVLFHATDGLGLDREPAQQPAGIILSAGGSVVDRLGCNSTVGSNAASPATGTTDHLSVTGCGLHPESKLLLRDLHPTPDLWQSHGGDSDGFRPFRPGAAAAGEHHLLAGRTLPLLGFRHAGLPVTGSDRR